jgi:hypothetical protein
MPQIQMTIAPETPRTERRPRLLEDKRIGNTLERQARDRKPEEVTISSEYLRSLEKQAKQGKK